MVNAKEVGETTTPSDVSRSCVFAFCSPAFCGPGRCLLALCWVYEARASQDPTMPRTSHVSMSVAMKRQKRSVIKLKFYVDV